MKTQPKKSRKNFASCMESETLLTPHDVFTTLAIDGALLHFNDELPELSDEEHQRILDVASVAAQTVLLMANVPDTWLNLVSALNYKREQKVRSEMWDAVFESLPESAKHLDEDKKDAEEKALACARPGSREVMQKALCDLEGAYMTEQLEVIYAAFQLGYEIAHDPTRLILEKGRGQ